MFELKLHRYFQIFGLYGGLFFIPILQQQISDFSGEEDDFKRKQTQFIVEHIYYPSLSVLQGMPWKFKKAGAINVTSGFKVNSGHMVKAAVLKSLGFAILPLDSCLTELNHSELIRINLNDEPEDLVLNAMYSGRKYPLKQVTTFLAYLQNKIINSS